MKKTLFLISAICCIISVDAQNSSAPVAGTASYTNSVLDGNGLLGHTYSLSKTGLNFSYSSQKLGQRFSPPGIVQPATFAISGIPATAVVEKMYLWTTTSGNGAAITVNIVNPNNDTSNTQMAIVGSGPDVCWSYPGAYTYRADVTSEYTGNGNYIISGLPVGSTNDVNGATLFIIYSDSTASFTGTISLHDGAVTINGGNTTQTVSTFTTTGVPDAAYGIMMIGDLQGLGAQLTIENDSTFTVTEDWWNTIVDAIPMTSGQTSCSFTVSSSGDCYNFAVAGVYFQDSVVTSIEESVFWSSLNVFPNPGDGAFSVTVDNFRSDVTIDVIDVSGRLISSRRIGSGGESRVSFSDLASGIYLVRCISGKEVVCRKAVVY
jgi:hypothetical protein